MRSWRMPVVVLVAVMAAGTLAGCHSSSGHGTHKSKKSRSRSSHYGSGSSAGHTTARPAASTTASSTTRCRGTQLSGSAHAAGSGTAVVVLRNTGSRACTLYGFPGVDLAGKDGTVSAERSTLAPTTVRVAAYGSASFTLHYTPNTTGGSGTTFTSLRVTPPDDTMQLTVPLTVNLGAGETTDPVTVDPVTSA